MENILSKRLKEERLAKGYTQQQLADLMNEENELDKKISRISITRYENGTRTPDSNTLYLLAYILGVDSAYLLGKSDKKHIEVINEELLDFSRDINLIISNDNKETNNDIWSILSDISALIKCGIKTDKLHIIKKNINLLSANIHYSINTNNPQLLDSLEKKLLENLRFYMKKNEEQLEKTLKEKRIKRHKEYLLETSQYINRFGTNFLDKDSLDFLKSCCVDIDEEDIPDNIRDLL